MPPAQRIALNEVDKDDPTPKYVQAQRILIEAIRRGQLAPGAKLPATKEIGCLVNISLITAHKALEGLVESGWLRREVGRGTYVRDDVGQLVGGRRQLSVGILLDHPDHVNIDDYYHSTIIDGLRRRARAGPHRVEFFFHDRFDLRSKGSKDVGAICVHPPAESQAAVERLAQHYPVLVLGGAFPNGGIASVDCDNEAGARSAVRHLYELGHRRFLVLSGPTNMTNSRDRAQGAADELDTLGLPLAERDLVETQDSIVLDEAARVRLQQRLGAADRPTAVIAGGFYLALAVMQIIRGQGLSIPGDVSVVGFDDPVSARLLDPPLTTVRQPLTEMASQACHLICQAVADSSTHIASCLLATELVVRGSTGPVG